MILAISGEQCLNGQLMHTAQFDRCEDGHQVFRCVVCHKDVAHEAEDSGCGG
jgi:hypothetical protein